MLFILFEYGLEPFRLGLDDEGELSNKHNCATVPSTRRPHWCTIIASKIIMIFLSGRKKRNGRAVVRLRWD